jgi:tRNA (guanine37-N1)-methyltransferase
MEIGVITIFPQIFEILNHGVIGRGKDKGLYNLEVINPRDFTDDSYRSVDDYPFGGGVGMVMKIEPIMKAYNSFLANHKKPFVILTDPKGVEMDDELVNGLVAEENLLIICGRYEGIDDRIDEIIDLKVSLGDFVLSGGEIPALAIIDSVVRKIPGVIGKSKSYEDDSFSMGMLDNSYYTRPAEFESLKVPDVLLSGYHKKIKEYRMKERIIKTLMLKPEILNDRHFSKEEINLLKDIYETLGYILKRENNA